ncbi:MAG: hypothetical protein JNK75_12175 [Betaproteobacteria bacterium]|nr:hypothetical protein [Betaproteobacteria bacterium]
MIERTLLPMISTFRIRLPARIWRALPIAAVSLVCAPVMGATFYVSPEGSDRGGKGTREAPWQTIGHGVSRLSGGDTLVVRDGLYQGTANFINSRLTPIASGTRAKPTVIRAENPLKVRIRNDRPLKYYDSMVMLGKDVREVVVDGFVLDMVDTVFPPFVADMAGDANTLKRIIVRRQGRVDNYGGWIAIGGSDNLVEDCAGVGAARYGFFAGGNTGRSQRNIFRRCVGRFDFSASPQPKATFAVYGNDDGHDVSHFLLQNCIAIDGQRGPRSGEETYAGFYFPKNASDVTVQGSLALNLDVAYAGFFIRELGGRRIRLENSVAWHVHGSDHVAGFRINGRTNDSVSIDRVTVGATRYGYYNRDKGSGNSLTRSLFVDIQRRAAETDAGWSAQSENLFFERPAKGWPAGSPTPSMKLRYLTQPRVQDLASNAPSTVGAVLTQRYGKSGARWGDPGFDQPTGEPLWPWAMEAQIHAVFSEPNDPAEGNVPAANDTRRGFAGAVDAFGQPQTLTRYVWQFLGHPMPAQLQAPAVR